MKPLVGTAISLVGALGLMLTGDARAQSLCLPGSDCCGAEPSSQTLVEPSAGQGNGHDTPAAFSRTYFSLPPPEAGGIPRVYQTVDACDVAGACSPGSVRYEWACATENAPAYQRAVKNKRDAWEVYVHTPAAAGSGAPPHTMEKTSVLHGAQDMAGTGALAAEDFTYSYGPGGQQQLASSEKASVFGGAGERARTYHRYNTSGRLVATIRSGWTRVMDRQTAVWTTQKRWIGTFYFVQRTGDSSPDPMGRVLETHGPCWVESEAATDCPAGSSYPLTQNFYWTDSDTTAFRRNRLMRVARFPAGPTSPPVETRYNAYDVAGNVTERVDANGVTTLLTWDDNRLLTQTVRTSSQVDVLTRYGHDAGHVVWMQRPEGNFEVYCYRTGTPTAACSGGQMTDKLQWKARAADSSGAVWTEKVAYAYWPDGSLKEERFLDSPGETRRVRSFAADAHLRPTHEKWGIGPGSYTAARSYDGADNLTGIGHAMNAPPSWCAVGGDGRPVSPACSALSYDRANRLIQVDEYPAEGQGQRTLLRHDAHGNVAAIKAGCLGNDTFEGCTQPATTFTYDDFGNLVGVAPPHMTGAMRYAYDAQGNKIAEVSPYMSSTFNIPLLYSYDHLSRLLVTQALYTDADAVFTHYKLAYDNNETPPAGCPTQLRSMGRLRYREDSFGRTWFEYNDLGRVIREIRVRANATGCGQGPDLNPDTHYSYTPNGNLASITYPHGRVVSYVHGVGAATDRISAVEVATHDGAAWQSHRVISDVRWEPYGGLRGYQQHHARADVTRSVEYMLGDNASVAPASSEAACSANPPSMAGSDLTGRLRGLRVSTGASSPGTGTGDIYSRTYTWTADQVRRMDTCVLDSPQAQTEEFTYDRTLRLTHAIRPAGNRSVAGGVYDSRSYVYDRRGNRTSSTEDGHVDSTLYYGASVPDHLYGEYAGPGQMFIDFFYYDPNGNVNRKATHRITTGDNHAHLNLNPADGTRDRHMRSISVGWTSSYYVYLYDAFHRRRLKDYPTGVRDEYFYDLGVHLLSDRGGDRIIPPVNYFVEDDYVWLGGRPVAVVRGKFTPQWTRLSDTSTECTRNGEAAACGLYFIVSDHAGRPVLMMDDSGRIAGTGEYDPMGHVNRVNQYAASANPYADNLDQELARFQQPVRSASLKVQQRVIFSLIDTEPSHDYVIVKDGSTGAQLAGPYSGANRGMVWSDWVEGTNGEIAVQFRSNATCDASACGPDAGAPVGCTCPGTARRRGIAIQNYEYRRFEQGASPFWTPLRRAGQYYDTETDLFEEGLRTYDPTVGRYFQPDPRVLNPEFLIWSAVQGRSAAPYVHAHNNPVQATQATGAFDSIYLQATPPWNVHPAPGASFGMDPRQVVELRQSVEQGGSRREAAGP